MSFREKHLWISIFSAIVVWSVYFRALIVRLTDGGIADPRFGWIMGLGFAGAVFVVAVIEATLTAIATFMTPKAERKMRDEREMTAALKASHIAFMTLLALIFLAATAAWFGGVIGDDILNRPAVRIDGNGMVVMANILLACGIVAELVRAAVTLMFLRALRA